MPSLYVVATPIGNLEDVTLRALRVLGEVSLTAAEDTRVTRKLLTRHGIHTRLTSYHDRNARTKLPVLMSALEDGDVALVCDAGTPGINDPGWELVAAALDAGVEVVPIPGPSAVTSAISVSGRPVSQYVYIGFLPRRRAERRRVLESLSVEGRSIVALEAPHRLRPALEDMLEVLGDRHLAACRELTKLHEEIFRGTTSEALDHFTSPRGEFTLVIEGRTEDARPVGEPEARSALSVLREKGWSARESVDFVSELSGLSRRETYRIWLQKPGPGPDGES